ncbi:MAG: hypothetical protein J6Y54_09050 [Lentisphaeria bacterium]|nr:hypothetical protein [Lentisphaeria bacterium]
MSQNEAAPKVKFQSRRAEYSNGGTVYAITYFGTRAQMEELAASHAIGESGGVEYGGGYLATKTVVQSSPGVWECELRYEAGQGSSPTPPEPGYGVKLTTLHGATLSCPLESHPDYRTKWNHYLFAAPDAALDSGDWLWHDTATDALLAAEDAKKFFWGKSLSECPTDAAGNRWAVVAEPTKKGVDSYDVATYTITETIRCTSRNNAGSQIANKLNKIGTPATTLGITGGNWKCDDAEVSWNGKCWIARLTWTRSGDNEGWDDDLYDNVSARGSGPDSE